MKNISFLRPALGALMLLTVAQAAAADTGVSAKDRAFVAKVSQGGMFEVQASKLAADKATAQDVKDIGNTEVHDHTLVGDKLKSIASSVGLTFPDTLNADFQGQLDHLGSLSGTSFDNAYIASMDRIHAKDGAAFAVEARTGRNSELRAFAAETHIIVLRHIGALHGSGPEK